MITFIYVKLPRWLSGKASACQCRRSGFNPGIGKIPWRREWLPTLVFLLGKSHRQRILVGYSPRGCKRVRHNWATEQQLNLHDSVIPILHMRQQVLDEISLRSWHLAKVSSLAPGCPQDPLTAFQDRIQFSSWLGLLCLHLKLQRHSDPFLKHSMSFVLPAFPHITPCSALFFLQPSS